MAIRKNEDVPHWSVDNLPNWSVDNRPTRDKDFVLCDPAIWSYLGVEGATANNIARGYTQWWKHHFHIKGALLPDSLAIRCARDHRKRTWKSIAESKVGAGFIFFYNAVLFEDDGLFNHWEIVNLDGSASRPRRLPSGQPIPDSQIFVNPFEFLMSKPVNGYYDSGENVLTERDWHNLALIIASGLAAQNRFNDEYLPSIGLYRTELPDGAIYKSGSRLADPRCLNFVYCQNPLRTVRWGQLLYDTKTVFDSHFFVAGNTRTGKTTILKLFFQSLAKPLLDRGRRDTRFVFYDAKPDLLPYLTHPADALAVIPTAPEWRPELLLHLLNPFDQRSTAWNIAKDAPNRDKAREIADVLFPEPKDSSDEFFSPAAQTVTAAVMDALNRMAPDNWTLYDLIAALLPENIEAVLSSNQYGKQMYETYFKSRVASSDDLVKTLANKTDRLLPAAWAWTHARESLSLTEWANSQTCSIVLVNDEVRDKAMNEVNRILLNLLCKQLLTVRNPPARTFLYLDEVEHLGKIETLKKIGQKGASRGVNMVLSLHDLDTLASVYKKETEGILSNCTFKAFLSLNGRATAELASFALGKQDVVIEQLSSQSGSTSGESSRDDGATSTESEQTGKSNTRLHIKRRLVSPHEITHLPLPTATEAITGYFMAPSQEPYKDSIPLANITCSDMQEWAARHDKENGFYALWPKDPIVRDEAPLPKEKLNPPDDTFATLYALGFTKPGYPPVLSPSTDTNLDEPEPDEPDISDEPETDPSTESQQLPTPQPPTAPPKKKHNLDDYIWDDELEAFRLKTDED